MSKDANQIKSDVRLRVPQRVQVVWKAERVDDLLAAEHRARTVWAVVCGLDLSAFHEPIKARQGLVGRDASDPRLLVGLWLYASLVHKGLVKGKRLTQDGLRVRASARSAKRLSKKQQTEQQKEPRASTTDSEASRMKRGDGGYRPAVNVQLAADTQSRAIVGVDVSNEGVDYEQSEPMRQQVEQRTGQKVQEHLSAGGRGWAATQARRSTSSGPRPARRSMRRCVAAV